MEENSGNTKPDVIGKMADKGAEQTRDDDHNMSSTEMMLHVERDEKKDEA